MATTTADVFQHTLEETDHWLEELAQDLGLDRLDQAYNALRGVLHTVRDRLTVEEASDLAAQLPLLVRGFYYEGWNPSHTPTAECTLDEFLGRISEKINEQVVDPEQALRAVGQLLRGHITQGQLNHVAGMMPAEVKEFFE